MIASGVARETGGRQGCPFLARLSKSGRLVVNHGFLVLCCCLLSIHVPAVGKAADTPTPDGSLRQSPFIPEQLERTLREGKQIEILVLFDDAADRLQAEQSERQPPKRLTHRAARYPAMKEAVLTRLRTYNADLIRDYSHLPMSWISMRGTAGLEWLRSRSDIVALYENRPLYTNLSQSMPFIGQPQVAEAGLQGAGVAVAIVDTGVIYTNAAFGPCTAPGVPENCRVAVSIDIAPEDNQLDGQGHGTNVSAIVAGVASQANLVVLDIFDGTSSTSSLLLSALNWVLANHQTHAIQVVNMSLGDEAKYTSQCKNRFTNPFLGAINDLLEVGITVVAAAGNNGYTDGISAPACTPGVLSVGAVYDANIGARNWTACSDATSSPDQIPCFSNSASFLSMLAPGTLISAGGYSASGTSQAAPHVAGVAAVLAAAQPMYSPDEIAVRLTDTGVSVTDTRNGYQFPRLNMATALAPEIEERQTTEGDVPFLPAWAFLTLGTAVLFIGLRKQRGQ